jgi:hypothetical protein
VRGLRLNFVMHVADAAGCGSSKAFNTSPLASNTTRIAQDAPDKAKCIQFGSMGYSGAFAKLLTWLFDTPVRAGGFAAETPVIEIACATDLAWIVCCRCVCFTKGRPIGG